MAMNKLLKITLLCITCTVLRILPAAAFSSISTTRSSLKASSSILMMSADVEETTIASIEEITTFASKNGVDLKFTTNPARGYRGVAVSKSDPENILGYIEGFIRPAGKVLHADKMEIFKGALNSARRENDSFAGGGTYLGPGLLIAFVCLLHGIENGCQTIEFLAIDDAEFQHKRLIRYYKTAGFEEVRYVGEELKDIPDRLVWGGCGTLMTNDVEKVLKKWTRIIRGANRRMENKE
mmetsp:Transcript_18410/g.28875  ORF Transcript_18410/g.28875 Transcript_18410/m.28875 type:complete len:238 (-) Transcript_18410:1764-2477(-)